jgi:hypothetical protein
VRYPEDDELYPPAWNGHLPALRQLWCLAAYIATPASSKRYGARLNAWRISVGREPLTENDIAAVRQMLRWRR